MTTSTLVTDPAVAHNGLSKITHQYDEVSFIREDKYNSAYMQLVIAILTSTTNVQPRQSKLKERGRLVSKMLTYVKNTDHTFNPSNRLETSKLGSAIRKIVSGTDKPDPIVRVEYDLSNCGGYSNKYMTHVVKDYTYKHKLEITSNTMFDDTGETVDAFRRMQRKTSLSLVFPDKGKIEENRTMINSLSTKAHRDAETISGTNAPTSTVSSAITGTIHMSFSAPIEEREQHLPPVDKIMVKIDETEVDDRILIKRNMPRVSRDIYNYRQKLITRMVWLFSEALRAKIISGKAVNTDLVSDLYTLGGGMYAFVSVGANGAKPLDIHLSYGDKHSTSLIVEQLTGLADSINNTIGAGCPIWDYSVYVNELNSNGPVPEL